MRLPAKSSPKKSSALESVAWAVRRASNGALNAPIALAAESKPMLAHAVTPNVVHVQRVQPGG